MPCACRLMSARSLSGALGKALPMHGLALQQQGHSVWLAFMMLVPLFAGSGCAHLQPHLQHRVTV
jgi:hypothetical protein